MNSKSSCRHAGDLYRSTEREHLQRDFLYGTAFSGIAITIATWALRGSWNLLLGWPALSFALVGSAYLLGDVRIFGKRGNGSRHWLATIFLFPYLAFAHFVWWAQISLSSEPATSAVNDRLVISRRLRSAELPHGIAQICDLTCEFVDPVRLRSRIKYVCHPILDAGASDASELAVLAKSLLPPVDGKLLIHCANGHGRTGMFAAVWLVAHGFVTSVDDAVKLIREARPGVSLRRRQYQLAMKAEVALQNIVEQSHATEPADGPASNRNSSAPAR